MNMYKYIYVNIQQRPTAWTASVLFPGGARDSFLLHCVQTGSEVPLSHLSDVHSHIILHNVVLN
jgi:hypothetical protein